MISDINIIQVDKDITVNEFLNLFVDSSIKDFTAKKFLDYQLLRGTVKDSGGKSINVTNLDRMFAQYSVQEKKDADSKVLGELIIKAGTQVGLPNNVVKRNSTYQAPDVFQMTDFKPFISNELKKLFRDPRYYSELRDVDGQNLGRVDVNDITVFAWIRATNSWHNISAFVEELQTSVTKQGGSFSLMVSPVAAEYLQNFGWFQDKLQDFEHGSVRDNVLSSSTISKDDGNHMIRDMPFFTTVLQENDLIYIKFERLAMEKEAAIQGGGFSAINVPGDVYDMIGLVDVVSTNTSDSSINIQVQGRDLMKLLIEDGSYFFPENFAQNIFLDENSVLYKRNLLRAVEGNLLSLSYNFQTVQTVLKFIVNKFSNLGMVPSEVFNAYGERLLKSKYELKTSVLKKNQDVEVINEINESFLNQEREGVWRICDLVFDPGAGERVLSDNSIAEDNGSIINSIRKVCQEPFVEFYGDTYGDKYNFIVRKPPFDENGYKGLVYDDVVSEDVLRSGLSKNDTLKASQIDVPLTNAANFGRPVSISTLVIDIDESEVITDNLQYSNETYSWYRLVPRGLGIRDNQTAFQMAPVIPIDEYAKIWGNKMYTIEYNYAPLSFIDDSLKDKVLNYAERQVFLDLQFLIQSHVYLPFTRFGNISIIGNRTIKRGMCIYYKPTKEIFYVDAVTNVKTLNDRSTILQVSRGMREKYIKGVDVSFLSGVKKVSYFNIMPTVIASNASINDIRFLKNWKIDSDVMNFFLQRRQWSDE